MSLILDRSSLIPVLPQEVIERIIDLCAEILYIARYTETLRACSLVCRAWVDRCQFHLYHIVSLKTESGLSRFIQSLSWSPRRARFVRHMQVGIPDSPDHEEFGRRWPVALAQRLPKLLYNLQSIHFQNYPSSPHPSTYRLLSYFKSVTTLVLTGCKFEKFSGFARLVQAFVNLTELQVRGISCLKHGPGNDAQVLQTPQLKRSKLTSLTVYTNMASDLFFVDLCAWISGTPSTNSLKSLTLTGTTSRFMKNNASSLRALLEAVSSNLEFLEMGVSVGGSVSPPVLPEESGDYFDFSSLNNLRELRIAGLELNSFKTFLLPLLTSLPSDRLEKLLLGKIRCHSLPAVRSTEWKPVDECFSAKKFNNLQTVAFGLEILKDEDGDDDDGTVTMRKVFETVEERLPKLKSRGLIHKYPPLELLGERKIA
ncbi:hypothetical protein C8Q75DRAFT_761227 [Abortiporus biennis]|nr:hypothetical protein C8Q75DRAFT_761227 [Abortiporus biennis]